MLHTITRRSIWFTIVLCLIVLPGCARSGAKLRGTLLLPPSVKLNDSDSVTINFVPEDLQGQVYPATFSPGENSFVAAGPNRKGIPAGTYKIALELHPYPGSSDTASRTAFFDSFNKYFTAGNTKLTYEVTAAPAQSLTIDLTQGKVVRN
jgi:hypothetical protein